MGISLRCLPIKARIGCEEKDRAIKGSPVSFDHADNDVGIGLAGRVAQYFGCRPGDVNSAFQ